MKSSLALFTLSLLLLFAHTLNARKDIGEYWKGVMNDQPMPEALQGLVRANPTLSSNGKTDCRTADDEKLKENFIQDFYEEPNLSVYDNNIPTTKDKYFVKYSKPRPAVTAANYVDAAVDGNKSFAQDVEPRPTVANYDNSVLQGEKSFSSDFEPGPNISVYDNGASLKEKKKISDDFEPRPSSITGVYSG